MSKPTQAAASRRTFLKNTGRLAAASTLAAVVVPHVHAAEDNTIRLVLIGCGGRGSGAAWDALSRTNGPTRLVAMADVFPSRLSASYDNLKKGFPGQVDVPAERKFIGFDAYRHAMDCLKPGDVAIMATPPAFRWVHFGYAIEKGLNVFMEKPLTVDGPSTRKFLALAETSKQRGLKVAVGLMCRHCRARRQLYQRIQEGQIGQIVALRAYRMHGPLGTAFSAPRSTDQGSELLWQIAHFHSFLWASGGCFSDFYIHNIDECCWMKDAWPVEAQASGGRHYRGNAVDQNFDNYSVEYTFADGTKLFLYGRTMAGCHDQFTSQAHGSKGSAIISTAGHSPAKCRIYKGYRVNSDELAWAVPRGEANPYQLEWEDLWEAIRQDKPYNEAKRGAEVSLVTAMGRMAAHTGQVVTFDQMLHHDHELGPALDQLTMSSPAPLRAGPDGKYPVPQPGIVTRREF
jgi:predicted dehydrogenase